MSGDSFGKSFLKSLIPTGLDKAGGGIKKVVDSVADGSAPKKIVDAGLNATWKTMKSLAFGTESVLNEKAFRTIERIMYNLPARTIIPEGTPYPANFRGTSLSQVEISEFINACKELKESELPGPTKKFIQSFRIDPKKIIFKK